MRVLNFYIAVFQMRLVLWDQGGWDVGEMWKIWGEHTRVEGFCWEMSSKKPAWKNWTWMGE